MDRPETDSSLHKRLHENSRSFPPLKMVQDACKNATILTPNPENKSPSQLVQQEKYIALIARAFKANVIIVKRQQGQLVKHIYDVNGSLIPQLDKAAGPAVWLSYHQESKHFDSITMTIDEPLQDHSAETKAYDRTLQIFTGKKARPVVDNSINAELGDLARRHIHEDLLPLLDELIGNKGYPEDKALILIFDQMLRGQREIIRRGETPENYDRQAVFLCCTVKLLTPYLISRNCHHHLAPI